MKSKLSEQGVLVEGGTEYPMVALPFLIVYVFVQQNQ